jgi:DivIVA domain-containing protein
MLFVIVVVLLAGLVAAVLTGRVPAGGVLPPVTSERATGLPRGGIDPEDVEEVRFDMVVRGYRMSQVDAVIERLVDEVRTRDVEIERLRRAAEEEPEQGEAEDQRVQRQHPAGEPVQREVEESGGDV